MKSNGNDRPGRVTVPLQLVYDAIETADDTWKQYLDIEKMEIVSLPEAPFMGEYDEEDQELADMIEEGWHTRFFGLPTRFDIHEYSIMERFIWDLPEGRIQDSLEHAIRGRGAFRRFKDAVRRFGIEQQWYDFQEKKYYEIATEWCDDHGFEYFNDKMSETHEKEEVFDEPEALDWREVRTEHLVQDEWIDFRRTAYQLPDGKVYEPFYNYSRRDYAVIVASDEEGNYLCVRQFRPGIRQVTTEFPAGGIERMDGREYRFGRDFAAAEEAMEAARRELLEETGYVSDDWKHVITVPSSATISDNYAYVFAAGNCRKSAEQKLDETEFLNVRKYSAAELEKMIHNGEFQQAVHIMAWLLSQK